MDVVPVLERRDEPELVPVEELVACRRRPRAAPPPPPPSPPLSPLAVAEEDAVAVEERAAPLALPVAEELEVAVAVEERAAAAAEEGNRAPKEKMKESNRSVRIRGV